MNHFTKTIALTLATLFTSTHVMGAERVLENLDDQKSTHKLLKVTAAEVTVNEKGQKKLDFEFAMPASESIDAISVYTDFQKREKTTIPNDKFKLFRSSKVHLSRKAEFGNGKYVTTKVQVLLDQNQNSTFGLTIHSKTGDVSVVFKMKAVANARYGKSTANYNGLSCTCYGGPGNYAYQCAPIQKTCYGGPGMYPYQCSVCP
jgi:hypothetical protein